jgi:hypothetical protein
MPSELRIWGTPPPYLVILKTLGLANILCKIRFLKELDIKIRETKDLVLGGVGCHHSDTAINIVS